MKSIIKKQYPYQAAGRTWIVPKLHLTKLPDDTLVLLEEEIIRIHRAIANEICGSEEHLSKDELEFLCDITQTPFSNVADYLGLHRSTLTKWRSTGDVPKNVLGLVLKKWFWFKLFGKALGKKTIKLEQLKNEESFLSFAKSEAIDRRLTEPIHKMTA